MMEIKNVCQWWYNKTKYIDNFKSWKKVERTKKENIMILPKCAVCDSKISKFIKEQEASELLKV